MEWKQFFASIIASLAWPAVLAYLLYLLRAQLGDLVGRISELTLPGGAGIKLSRQVERVSHQAEKVEAEVALEQPFITTLDPKTLKLANEFPEAAFLDAYKELEGVLLSIRPRLTDTRPFRNPTEVMRRLHTEGRISLSVVELFDRLRQARNTTVHARREDGLTPGEAVELIRQTKSLTELLIRVSDKLPASPRGSN